MRTMIFEMIFLIFIVIVEGVLLILLGIKTRELEKWIEFLEKRLDDLARRES